MLTTGSLQAKNSRSQAKPIGLFDSGLGGLTILREVVKVLPYESITYLGDTARLPYGDKSADTVIHYARQNSRFLLAQEIKILVIACHTASSYALKTLEEELPIPVLGVTMAGVNRALETTKNGRIAVLGTRATINANVYQQELKKRDSNIRVHTVACPLFVPLVEEGFHNHPATELIVQEYLRPLIHAEVDTVILGCTHYPMLSEVIQRHIGDCAKLIDCGQACAAELKAKLHGLDCLNEHCDSEYQYFVTDDPLRFRKAGEAILQTSIETVRQCVLDMPQ